MKKNILTILAATACTTAFAQSIGREELAQIQASFVKDPSTVALQNVLTGNKDIPALAMNIRGDGPMDDHFKYETSVRGITNQRSSGRCWLFASLNDLRPTVMAKYNLKSFDFSHNFDSFWDLFEKSNLFLESVIATAGKPITDREVSTYFKAPVSDGGVWNFFINLAGKYGVCPAGIMPETEHSNNTANMRKILQEKLRTAGWELRKMYASGADVEAIRKQKIENLKEVYRILALCLGEPPVEFTWRYKDADGNCRTLTTTPLEFYRSIVPGPFDNSTHIMVMNDPTREYYRVYDIKNYRNSYEGFNWTYLNLPMADIKRMALASIKDDDPMYTSSDVGKYSIRDKGLLDLNNYDYQSLFGIRLDMDKEARILTLQSGSSHAMLLVACDTDENDVPTKWKFENSWGSKSGKKGYMYLTDEWLDAYLFRIVIDRKYLDEKALAALETTPIEVPVWDYMN